MILYDNQHLRNFSYELHRALLVVLTFSSCLVLVALCAMPVIADRFIDTAAFQDNLALNLVLTEHNLRSYKL